MKFGINIATLGQYADPRFVVQLAQAAEASFGRAFSSGTI
jgi:hypothetical protein